MEAWSSQDNLDCNRRETNQVKQKFCSEKACFGGQSFHMPSKVLGTFASSWLYFSVYEILNTYYMDRRKGKNLIPCMRNPRQLMLSGLGYGSESLPVQEKGLKKTYF